MAVLPKSKYEQFAQLIARGEKRGSAYSSAFGQAKGAEQSASRLLRNAKVSGRIAELQLDFANELRGQTLLERSARLKALEDRHKLLNQVISERAATYGRLSMDGAPPAPGDNQDGDNASPVIAAPGAATGLLCLDWRGKDAVQAVWKVDTGLLSELRLIEEQIARELGELNPEPTTRLTVPVQVNVQFVSAAING